MMVPFEQLSLQSRLWIYASKTAFTQEQLQFISEELDQFIASWEAHGVALKASYRIEYGHFIILAVDEAHHAASGCSIDKSVQAIRTIESKVKVDVMDRMVAYALIDKAVNVFPMHGLKAAIEKGILTVDSQIFDHSISSIQEYYNNWIKRAGNTWLSRYFSSVFN